MTQSDNILLSIVVPTKNRYFYLKELIELVERLHSNKVELVIQDNTADNSEILSFMNEKKYSFINYNHIEESISMTENSDAAILNSRGEYICFIGDDDGVVNNILHVVQYMKEHDIDAVVPKKLEYNWPDFVDNSIFNLSATLIVPECRNKFVKVDVNSELKKSINNGFKNMGLMPRVYQGIVKKESLNRIYYAANTYFPGPSPDMANAVALSVLNVRTYFYDGLAVISGQSKNVGGGERAMKGNLKKIEDIPFMPKDVKKTWDQNIPQLWCSDTVWPQSAINTLKSFNYSAKINYNLILGRFLFNHKQYRNYCRPYVKNKALVNYYILKEYIDKIIPYFKNRYFFLTSGRKRITAGYLHRNVMSVLEVLDHLGMKSFSK